MRRAKKTNKKKQQKNLNLKNNFLTLSYLSVILILKTIPTV
jgi:hypothetical protein